MAEIKLSGEVYYPSNQVLEKVQLKDRKEWDNLARKDYLGFWEKFADELHWFKKWEKVLDDSSKPFFKWFTGGKTNICYNCLDRHLQNYRRNKLALIWESEDGKTETMSYFRLHQETCRFANVLKSMGVRKGDRVTIYMGRIPEIVTAMLACARIGAVHSVVYGGFSVESLTERIEDSQSRVLVVADGAYQRGKIVPLKEIADEALKRAGTVEHVVVVKRTGEDVFMQPGRDMWYHELVNFPIASTTCQLQVMSAEDPLFILYTSGTTGKPKAILHTHGGYMVGTYVTTKYYLDLQDEDRIWCTADPGWITGHSYIVYGPLLNGATIFMYEGAPYHPYPNRWWQMIEKYGINILYTAPTAIRGFMRFGDSWAKRHNLSSLRLLGSVGEPINPEAWKWYHTVIGNEKCPIIDTWWQTETGMHMIAPFPSEPLKPGSGGRPFPGITMEVLDEEGKPVGVNQEGFLVIKTPWPAMVRTLFNDDQRFIEQYWSKYKDCYLTGDSARIDEDGYIWVIGRVDDVIKVSGYRLGSADIESACVSHPAVAEAAAIGVPHHLKGNAINVFVILKSGFQPGLQLVDELKAHIGHEVGPIAKPEKIEFVDKLPKTRSGKIMRRVLKAQAMGVDPGNISTLED
jgi:acetyl-CoA synthetase